MQIDWQSACLRVACMPSYYRPGSSGPALHWLTETPLEGGLWVLSTTAYRCFAVYRAWTGGWV